MTQIHMDTESVRELSKNLMRVMETLREQFRSVNSSSGSMDWMGGGRDQFSDELMGLTRALDSLIESGISLATRVGNEVIEWEQTAATFGGGEGVVGATVAGATVAGATVAGAPAVNASGNPEKLTNMQELAKFTMGGNPPIKVFKTGENQYLITISGTTPKNPELYTNPGGALEAGLGIRGDYEERVRDIMLTIGGAAGASFILAGHSLGGIVAQNLANSNDLGNNKIKSIVTFGSPYSAPENSKVGYTRYAAEGDPITYLEGRDARAIMGAALISTFKPAPVAIATVGSTLISSVQDRYAQIPIPGSSGGMYADHMVYKDSPTLAGKNLSTLSGKEAIDLSGWTGEYTGYDAGTPTNGLAKVYQDADQISKNVAATGVRVYESSIQAVSTTAHFYAEITNMTAEVVSTSINQAGALLPKPISVF